MPARQRPSSNGLLNRRTVACAIEQTSIRRRLKSGAEFGQSYPRASGASAQGGLAGQVWPSHQRRHPPAARTSPRPPGVTRPPNRRPDHPRASIRADSRTNPHPIAPPPTPHSRTTPATSRSQRTAGDHPPPVLQIGRETPGGITGEPSHAPCSVPPFVRTPMRSTPAAGRQHHFTP